ncbi:uncharacterized protein LOC131237586 isoform X1 [Magnolia sinica]|uniref:uncharacterized protein LOC131237586 isoform X1 n=1 Tax=Magnolia sinica TaxID=86752 RepID=UPI0026598F4B|nr:uncharacterized protein LOC131237586 isoform X1 [Magnolia sinica]XP_058091417.1 uncharacterized protein LOC131237586 isoform X1 [Magnolia sinica]
MANLESEISPEPNANPSKTRFRRKQKQNSILQNPLISSSSSSSSRPLQTTTTCKSSISSLFLSTFSPSSSSSSKKTIFTSATFRGLGCASHAEVSAPAAAAVRSSADWQAKRVRKKKQRRKKQPSGSSSSNTSGPAVVVPDVWCSPGIGFVADDAAVDCVVARRAAAGTRGRADGERNQGERPCIVRRSSNLEHLSSLDSPSAFETRRSGPDLLPAGHYRHPRGFHRSPGGLAEIMMLQTGFLLGGPDGYDRYRDWRLDVDNMSYEELLELGDRIGYVNTGLREDEIFSCLRKMKHSILDALPPHLSTGMEWKCSICQEEYEADDEVGKLECGHGYHIYCIKQWLLQKNACPVCKAAAADAAL